MVPEINLLPQLERRKSSNILLIFSAIVIGLIVVFLCVQFFTLKKEIKGLEVEETQRVVERDLLSAEISAVNPEEQGTHSTAVVFVETVSYPVSPLIDELYSLIEVNTYLRSYQFNEAGIFLSADFETMNDISFYIERLLNSAYFSDVKVEAVSTFEPVEGLDAETDEVNFDVQGRYSATIQLDINASYLSEGGTRDE
ncbi:PilN domain-containing protein [Psychrobacillus sp. FSL H8-0487]|uniref:PilN domain-containing protein n=1 Tax=Psychrobacillus sp. FSL H8-0487 TaxID=2921391 RepID=UPI0030F95E69